jgi:AraC-binding-like domain
MSFSSSPLDNFPLVRTRNVEEAQDALARIYVRPTLKLAAGCKELDAAINNCQLKHIGLAYGAFGAAVGVEYPATDFFVQFFPIRGSGKIFCRKMRWPLTVDSGATISPNTGFKASYNAGFQYLVLRIASQALTKKLISMAGTTINEPLRIEPRQDLTRPAAELLQRYFLTLVDTLSTIQQPLPDWWIEQTEQLLMTLFLCGHRHNYSHLLETKVPDAAPGHVRHAEQYIEANWRCAITLDDLAAVAGVSAFDLFRSFKESRGYSPLAFVAQVRAKRRGAKRKSTY